jgi:hypothetical protein
MRRCRCGADYATGSFSAHVREAAHAHAVDVARAIREKKAAETAQWEREHRAAPAVLAYRHADKVTDLDHAARRDPRPAASSSGPVFVCIECSERVVRVKR